MEMQNVKNKVTNVFTPARLKKAAALAVLIGIVSAGGAYYHHSRAEALSMREKQARSEMIAAQAEQHGIAVLDEARVRTIAADAIGKSEAELNFRSVDLTMKDHDDRDGKHDGKRKQKHDRREHREDRRMHDRDARPMMPPPQAAPAANPAPAAAPTDAGTPSGTPAGTAPAPVAPPVQPAPMMGQPNFHPVYKVKCCAGNVEYKLYIDAVTGTVLSSKADVDDDLF